MVNAANAQILVDWFDRNPDKHAQNYWVAVDGDNVYTVTEVEKNFCGTTMCVAGLAGYLLTDEGTFKDLVEGDASWADEGAKVLGLDKNEAEMLFYTMSDKPALDMLRAIAADDMKAFHEIYRGDWEDDEDDELDLGA